MGSFLSKNGDRLMASDWIGGHPYEGMKGFFRRASAMKLQAKRGLRSMGS